MHAPPVALDPVAVDARAATAARFAPAIASRGAAIDLAIATIDLTTLEGRDTPGRVRALCAKAVRPAPGAPRVAAVCVYPALVAVARAALGTSPVLVAAVATAFPSGLSALDVKLADAASAVDAGADEIDMVIDRAALLAGDEQRVAREIAAVRDRCPGVTIKVILETGELGTYDLVRRASEIALVAGADFIKTSTGKIGISATLGSALVMSESIRDHAERTGHAAGIKIAGGVRDAAAALRYIALVENVLGAQWLRPERLRIGASALLDELLAERIALATGRRPDPRTVGGE